MKNLFLILFLMHFLIPCTEQGYDQKKNNLNQSINSVVYLKKGRHRLGDTLMRYIMDKTTSFYLGIPLYYDPFEFSEDLMLSEFDFSTDKWPLPFFDNHKRIFFDINNKSLTLEPNAFYCGGYYNYLTTDIMKKIKEEPELTKILKKALSPKKPLELIYPPQNIISVAVHIRKGINFDGLLSGKQILDPKFQELNEQQKKTEGQAPTQLGIDYAHPLKFPPEQYYIDQIKNLFHFLNEKPLYVYIFTDYPGGKELTKRIKTIVNIPIIQFDCHQTSNHNINVLVDLFSIAYNFDCLIRPGLSAFSIIAHFIGNHKIVIYPTKFKKFSDHIEMREIKVDVNAEL